MNQNEMHLLRAVCENNMKDAKAYARIMLEADNTQKNKVFCQRMLNRLREPSANLMELPANLSGILMKEDVSMSFRESRYYLNRREEELLNMIMKMSRAANKLSEMSIHYRNAAILYGDSGTGKTTFGRYAAYKLGVPFSYLNMSNLLDSHLGNTQKNIGRAFDHICIEPCVFMLDELDAIGERRGSDSTKEMSRITISLIPHIDRLPNEVILLAATNRLDIIDEALLRRFSLKHKVEMFRETDNRAMVLKFLSDVGFSLDEDTISRLCGHVRPQAEIMDAVIRIIADHLISTMDKE